LRQESVRKILLCILAEKGCNQKSIVDKVGHSVSTVSWHLKRLEESGIVMSVNVGKEKRYTLSADETELMRLLVTYKRSLLDTMVDRIVETWEE
jgi:predicted transcriptional regulator